MSFSGSQTNLAERREPMGSQEVIVMENRKSVYQADKRRILRNVLIICVAWVFLFTAFASLTNLQSSINSVEGLGTAGLAVVYGGLVLSCMIVPPALISRLGCKWTIAVSMVGYILYMVANFHASWFTIIPGSVLLGLSAAPLWSAKCTYLTEVGVLYAQMNRESAENVIARFFGYFFGFFQTSHIWGNLMSSFILGDGTQAPNFTTLDLSHCGIYHCSDDENNTNLRRPKDVKIYSLLGSFVACSIIALVLICFLDNIKVDNDEDATKFDPRTLAATFLQMKNIYQILLIPITIYSGLEQGYFASDFTKAFVSCSLGIWMIGFVMICYGICDALGSYLTGKLNPIIGRISMFISAFVIHSGCMITLMLWRPTYDLNQRPVFFVIAGLWGLADSVWQTQINAFYGTVFPKKSEAAFANYRLWESIGFILAFGYANFLCVRVKTYITWLVLVVGIICYSVTEYLVRKNQSKDNPENMNLDDLSVNRDEFSHAR